MSKNKIQPTEPIEPIELKLDFSLLRHFWKNKVIKYILNSLLIKLKKIKYTLLDFFLHFLKELNMEIKKISTLSNFISLYLKIK